MNKLLPLAISHEGYAITTFLFILFFINPHINLMNDIMGFHEISV